MSEIIESKRAQARSKEKLSGEGEENILEKLTKELSPFACSSAETDGSVFLDVLISSNFVRELLCASLRALITKSKSFLQTTLGFGKLTIGSTALHWKGCFPREAVSSSDESKTRCEGEGEIRCETGEGNSH